MQDEELPKEIVDAVEKAVKSIPETKPSDSYGFDNPNRAVWEDLIKREKEGSKLSAEDIRTLELRRASLEIANCWDKLLHDPTLKDDPTKEAEVLTRYGAEMQKLQKAGITKGMHVGKPKEFFSSPQAMAEYVAGQLIDVAGGDTSIPSEREVMPTIQEVAEKQINIPSNEPDQAKTAGVISSEFLTPKLKDFMVMRSVVNVTHHFLASELNTPPQPKTP